MELPESLFFFDLVTGKKVKSFQNQRDKYLSSHAHGGSGLKGRDLQRRMKGMQVIKKKSIWKKVEFSNGLDSSLA